MSIASFTKDPDAILDYEIDWTAWLAGNTITSSTWTVPTGLTSEAESKTDTTTLIRLSGGTDRSNYEVTNHIVASNGEEDERTMTILVRNQ